ncbi:MULTISPECIES: phosphatase PAP2 family protein [unclassified Bradyrhizobium]|uniref:phosphatase PAP2 family protein n=1 Tax=unclassified Bradyrhizobium TaxID=2631580 RepID=UPI00247B2AB3|nr:MULTISPECIES: phosphatase PAP2 family protein [unclassified Bradyrhizobium]WGS20237.1 phosphatase PAP2 family protein [Bradyrhizobium sp. ISRA463]WGS27106.1 phosphatase PAP2 family protein [Bradyrhizobium sp. ISRA464]
MTESDTRLAWRLFNLNWIPIAVMSSVLLLAVLFAGFSLEPVAFGVMSGMAGEFALMVYLYFWARGSAADPKLIFGLGAIAQLLLIVTIMGPLTYVALALNWPLQDHTFLAIDRAMGLDPEALLSFVNDHAWLMSSLVTGYGFIKWFLLGVPIILAATLRLVRLQQFIAAFSLALAVTLVISALVPAVGTFYGLNISPADFPSVHTKVYEAQLRDILAVRSGVLRHLKLFELAGVVSFPSFHAASAVLYLWALWPVRVIGIVAAVMNVLMVASTPVIGAHYVIDVIAGVLLAVICIAAAKYATAFLDSRAPVAELGYVPTRPLEADAR